MRPLILALVLPCLGWTGKPTHDFAQVNAHFAAKFSGHNPQAINAEIARDFKSAARFGVERMSAIEAPREVIHVAGRNYRVTHMQLVSIVDRDAPVAYTTLMAPTKESIKTASKRKLETYELAAIAELESGKEVQVDEARSLVFGALRADHSCLKCHAGKAGDLFGAFRYSVFPIAQPKPLVQPKSKSAPVPKSRTEPLVSLR